MDPSVETSTPVPEQPPVTATTDTPAAAESIAAHAAAFGPDSPQTEDDDGDETPAVDRARDEQGRFARHRATSQQAGSRDVPRIRELTKKWRAEESGRKDLEAKYAALAKEIETLKAPKVPEAPKPFEAKAPEFDAFSAEPDPLAAYVLAMEKYGREKAQSEAAQAAHQSAASAAEHAEAQRVREWEESLRTKHGERVKAFMAHTPDFERAVKAAPKDDLPPVLRMAIWEDDKSAEFVYALATRPELLAEAVLVSDGRALTETNVANMRRLLAARMPAASTGSAASRNPTYTPPKPPNPVRTGPIRTADEPPGEASSISEHSKYYGRRR